MASLFMPALMGCYANSSTHPSVHPYIYIYIHTHTTYMTSDRAAAAMSLYVSVVAKGGILRLRTLACCLHLVCVEIKCSKIAMELVPIGLIPPCAEVVPSCQEVHLAHFLVKISLHLP